jgi:hypothetical protein
VWNIQSLIKEDKNQNSYKGCAKPKATEDIQKIELFVCVLFR